MAADAALTGGLSIVDDQHAVTQLPGDGLGKCLAHRQCALTHVRHQSGTTAVAWISTLARSSTSATTCIAAIAG